MSERRGGGGGEAPSAEELLTQVDAVADQLYGLPPDEFSPARDEYIRQAREQHNQPLARELAKLRKPTLSAWLLNLLWRDQRPVMEQLFELAGELSQAQAEAAGPALRELTAQRRQLENALLRQAAALAEQAGVRVSDSVVREAQETLTAALAVPEVADELRKGRLVKPASYAGFGAAAPGAGAARQPTPTREPISLAAAQRARAERRTDDNGRGASVREPPAPAQDDESSGREAEQLRAEEEARREREAEEQRRAARRRLDDARAAADLAHAELARTSRVLAAAEQREADLRQQLETLRDQLRRVEAEVQAAEQAAADARSSRERAQAAEAETAQAETQAEEALNALRR
jgi:hypothetical protein